MRAFTLSAATSRSPEQLHAPEWFSSKSAEPSSTVHPVFGASAGHDLARFAIVPAAPVLQTKVQLDTPGDVYEQEAERVADAIVATTPLPAVSSTRTTVQRMTGFDVTPFEEEEKLPAQVQAMSVGGPESLSCAGPQPSGGDHTQSRISSRLGAGTHLPEATRFRMESQFQTDFSQVRIHTGEEADSLNRTLQSHAFTTGHDIFFAHDQFRPGAREGDHLLAHELAHVVQQRGDRPAARIQRSASFTAGKPRAALNVAERVLGAQPYLGNTLPVLNGTVLTLATGQPLETQMLVATQNALKGPQISYTAQPNGKSRCQITSVPANDASFDMEVPTKGPWTFETTKANMAATLGAQAPAVASACAGGKGNVKYAVHGKPSDADIATAVRVHEDEHAKRHEKVFNQYVVPWDQAMDAEVKAGKYMEAPNDVACEKGIEAKIGGSKYVIGKKLYYDWIAEGNAFHGTPAGQKMGVCDGSITGACDLITNNVKLPGVCPP